MKVLLMLITLIFLNACSQNQEVTQVHKITKVESLKIIKEKNLTLTNNDALSYFFYTEGLDKETQEPNAESESDYFYTLQESQDNFILFDMLKISNVLSITQKYILVLLHPDDDYDTLLASFKLDGTPINFLVLDKSFGTNEFSIQRIYKQLDTNIFMITDERYDVEWIVHPTKGIKKLTSHNDFNVTVNEKGLFI
jgi:hypothetical protein